MVISKDEPSISTPYRGRFAPSPTGPLHLGSLIAATGSYLDALSHGGQWLVRVEDVDLQRTVAGAANDILRTLEAFGFEWDETVLYQSRRLDIYREVLQGLTDAGLVYACGCTRKEIADSSVRGIDGPVYSGVCRNGLPANKSARAWRLRLSGEDNIVFKDLIQGEQRQCLTQQLGDFVLLRADGNFAYQLAVVIDDAAQSVTHVVRGADLLDSTPRQIYLQNVLNYSTPRYAHLPVLTNLTGEKLSKQTLAPRLMAEDKSGQLIASLKVLGQSPPQALFSAPLADIWTWAKENWCRTSVPKQRAVAIEPN